MNSLIVYKELIQRYIKEILNTFEDKVQAATVFGSVARGEARDDSDIDMLIIVSNDRRKIQEAIVPAVDLKVDDWAEYKRLLEKGIRTKIFEIIKTEKELRDNPLILLTIQSPGTCSMRNRQIQLWMLPSDANRPLKISFFLLVRQITSLSSPLNLTRAFACDTICKSRYEEVVVYAIELEDTFR